MKKYIQLFKLNMQEFFTYRAKVFIWVLIKLYLGDDLIKARWFRIGELTSVKQIPGGKEFFQKIGYIEKN